MALVSRFLRSVEGGGFAHWCPGCDHMHVLPGKRGWTFVNGDADRPSFTPSFKHTWDEGTPPVDKICHYVLTDGVLNFCNDCTHHLKGCKVPLPPIP